MLKEDIFKKHSVKEEKQGILEACGTHPVDPHQVFSQDDENHFVEADNLLKVSRLFSSPNFRAAFLNRNRYANGVPEL